MKIDIHNHVLMPETLGKAGKYGPEYIRAADGSTTIRVGEYTMTMQKNPRRDPPAPSPQAWVEAMDRDGVDKRGLTISPLFYMYWAEPKIGIEYSRLQNDSLANFCRPYPDRFFFMATLPLQDIHASLKELDRAINQLGAKGVNIGTHDLAGRDLDDPALAPIYERVQRYDVPLFVHPYPLEIYKGRGRDKYNMSWQAGYIHGETVAVVTLMFGGVLDEFPNLKICISHGGGAVPYQFGRFEDAASVTGDIKAKKPLRTYLSNFYFDVVVHDLKSRQFLVDFMGVDNLVVGSNFPGWDAVDGFKFAEELALSAASKQKILGGNAAKLFKLG